MQKLEKLRNLLVMAACDGSLTQDEIKYLTDRCGSWGISESEFAREIQFALSEMAEVVIPPRKADRIAMLTDMIAMMAADGELADLERNLFAVIAARMNLSEQELNDIIDSLTNVMGSPTLDEGPEGGRATAADEPVRE